MKQRLNAFDRFFLGIATDPQVVAATRALVIYLLPLGTEAAVVWLSALPPAWLGVAVPTAFLLRALEGAVDRRLKGSGGDPVPPQGIE